MLLFIGPRCQAKIFVEINVGPGICRKAGTDAFLLVAKSWSLLSGVHDEKETALVVPASSEIDLVIFLDDTEWSNTAEIRDPVEQLDITTELVRSASSEKKSWGG